MSNTQAVTIRNLLIAAIQKYDFTINLDTSGKAYNTIVKPVYDALTPDMFDTDIDTYLMTVLKEMYPSLELQSGDVIVDLLIRPLQIMLEPLKAEINLLKKRQSVRYADQMTMDDAEDLAANFFLRRRTGEIASGSVRVLLSRPTFVTISEDIEFYTNSGLIFSPTSTYSISASTVAAQRLGALYYIDVEVEATAVGEEYNVAAGGITTVRGINNVVSVNNPFAFTLGSDQETVSELFSRVERSLTERSMTTKQGAIAKIEQNFQTIRSMEIIGYGDPEMVRDILTGNSDGRLRSSGVSFIFGKYVFMLCGYEDNKDGYMQPAPGDRVSLNYWKFIYKDSLVEQNEIQEVLYNSYGDFPDIPTIHIFMLKENPKLIQPVTGALPGVLPGVFTSIFSEDTITISGLPENILTAPLSVPSNNVHIGGKFDIWMRPTSLDTSTSIINVDRSPYPIATVQVSLEGDLPEIISGIVPTNRLGTLYTLVVSPTSGRLYTKELVRAQNGTVGYIMSANTGLTRLAIIQRSGPFVVGETITGLSSNAVATIQRVEYTPVSKKFVDHTITIDSPTLTASFYIIDTFENYFIISETVSTQSVLLPAYIHKHTGIQNIFNPSTNIFPKVADYAVGLQSYINQTYVDVPVDLTSAGIRAGDFLKIHSGQDIGMFSITNLIGISTALTRITVANPLTRTNSNLRYSVVRTYPALQAPLVRILPGGMSIQSAGGSVYSIPYAKPVGAYALGAFSSAQGSATGRNGFVLPNLPIAFRGSNTYISDLSKQADPTILAQIRNHKIDNCISSGCSPCRGLAVTCTVTIDGNPTSYSTVKFYMTGAISLAAQTYLLSLHNWFIDVINTFFRTANVQATAVADDLTAFIDMLFPILFGEPVSANEHIVTQFEICLPDELFDGLNNSYIAIPEIDWDSEFADVDTFEEAITRFLSGTMRASKTALSTALPGDTLKIQNGANAGEYVIHKVVNVPVYNGECILTETSVDDNGTTTTTTSIVEEKAYIFSVVIIKGTFPVESLNGTSEFFRQAIPNIAAILPTLPPPNLNITLNAGPFIGTQVNPFNVAEEVYSVLFKFLYQHGFDTPEYINVIPSSFLKKLTKSMFSAYVHGKRSCRQTTRLLFMDPVTVTVYSPRASKAIPWKPLHSVPPAIYSSNSVDLAAYSTTDIYEKRFTVYYCKAYGQSSIVLSAVYPSFTAPPTMAEFAAWLQSSLDPDTSFIKVTAIVPSPVNPYDGGILIQALVGGEGAFIQVNATYTSDGFYYLAMPRQAQRGVTTVGDLQVAVLPPHIGTRLSITQQNDEKFFIVDAGDVPEYYASIMPKAIAALTLQFTSLSRDAVFNSMVGSDVAVKVYFTEDGESPLAAGVRPGDLLFVHEQVNTLDTTGLFQNPFADKFDRPIHVQYNSSAKTATLLNTSGTFLSPESSSMFKYLSNVVNVGDIVFFEDAGRAVSVVRVEDTALYFDVSVPINNQTTIYESGYDGIISGQIFRSALVSFAPRYKGQYLVLYGSEHSGVDGTYTITDVINGQLTLDSVVQHTETNIHWAIVKPSFEEIGSSTINGFSSTIGLTPIRIYRSIAREFPVVATSHHLNKIVSSMDIVLGTNTEGPKQGYRQPYKVLRPLENKITASEMQAQGTSEGMYYFDVPTTTLTPDFSMNVPENTQSTPVMNTLSTEGYWLETRNKAHTFSTREECTLMLSSSILPKEAGSSITGVQSVETKNISISYEFSSIINSVQSFIDADANKSITADVLIKHFLPSYVHLQVSSRGGQTLLAAQDMATYIDSLLPTDSLQLSKLEEILHRNGVSSYSHPIYINCMTIDLNRDIILTRVDDTVDDTTILHDGTNRLTYFIVENDSISIG